MGKLKMQDVLHLGKTDCKMILRIMWEFSHCHPMKVKYVFLIYIFSF